MEYLNYNSNLDSGNLANQAIILKIQLHVQLLHCVVTQDSKVIVIGQIQLSQRNDGSIVPGTVPKRSLLDLVQDDRRSHLSSGHRAVHEGYFDDDIIKICDEHWSLVHQHSLLSAHLSKPQCVYIGLQE